jgi:hypothetical protein
MKKNIRKPINISFDFGRKRTKRRLNFTYGCSSVSTVSLVTSGLV